MQMSLLGYRHARKLKMKIPDAVEGKDKLAGKTLEKKKAKPLFLFLQRVM